MFCRHTGAAAKQLIHYSGQCTKHMLETAKRIHDAMANGKVPGCIGAMAAYHGTLDILLRQLLVHRQIHGEYQTEDDPTASPALIRVLIEDLNECLTTLLNVADPAHAYKYKLTMIALLKVKCGWCGTNMGTKEGEPPLGPGGIPLDTTTGICPPCAAKVEAEIKALPQPAGEVLVRCRACGTAHLRGTMCHKCYGPHR